MKTFPIISPLFRFNRRCYQCIYKRFHRMVSPGPATEVTMKYHRLSCKQEFLSVLDLELENMAIGGGLTLTREIMVSVHSKK